MSLRTCTACGAAVADAQLHADWHEALRAKVNGLPAPDPRTAASLAEYLAADEAPTQKFPALGGPTVFRRPPPPVVRELKGADLLRAIADELAGYDDEDQADDVTTCGAAYNAGDGVEWICGREPGHEGTHEVHGRRWL